jgi:hypothetical protein
MKTDGLLFTTFLTATAIHTEESDAALIDAYALWKGGSFTRMKQRLRTNIRAGGAKRTFTLQKIELRHFTGLQLNDVGFASLYALAASITAVLSTPPGQSDAISRRYALPGKEFTSRQRHRFTLNGGKEMVRKIT